MVHKAGQRQGLTLILATSSRCGFYGLTFRVGRTVAVGAQQKGHHLDPQRDPPMALQRQSPAKHHHLVSREVVAKAITLIPMLLL